MVEEEEVFWWDAVTREASRRKYPDRQIRDLISELVCLSAADARQEIKTRFGQNAFSVQRDIERPLNVAELKQLASSKWVEIGNHTYDHCTVAGRTKAYARHQFEKAQDAIEAITGCRLRDPL